MAPTTVGPTTITVDGIEQSAQLPYQRKAFYANGRYWAFFISNAEMKFSSSADGVTWEALISIRAAAEGAEFSTWLQEIGGIWYIHYAYSDVVGGSALYYRRGILNANGTITWSAEQIAVAQDPGYEYESIGIVMDQIPAVWICYVKVEIADPNNTVPMVTHSITSPSWATSPGFPFMLTATQDASWTIIMVPWSMEIIAIYAADGGNIYSRIYTGGMWFPEVDTGHDIISSYRMSAAAEYFDITGAPTDAHLVFQDLNEDLIHTSYSLAGGWSAPHTILAASDPLAPMLTALWYGNEDGASMRPSQQLYCFWLPLTADPIANYVTYKVSRDSGATWTNEAGGAGSTSWCDETAEGLSNILAGSAFYRSSSNPAAAKTYIGVLYTNQGSSPDYVRGAGLEFDDPDEDLLGAFTVRQLDSQNLIAGFVVRHTIVDIVPELLGGFSARRISGVNLFAGFIARQTSGAVGVNLYAELAVRQETSVDLLGYWEGQTSVDFFGEFDVRQETTRNLYGEFFINQGDVDLLGIFNAQHAASEDLPAGFDGQAVVDLLGVFTVRNIGAIDLLGEFEIRRTATRNLPAIFFIRDAATVNLLGEFIVRHAATSNLLGEFIVRQPGSVDLPAHFRMDKEFISKGLNVSVYRDMSIIS